MSTPTVALQFDRIVPCVCTEHAVVRLFDADRSTRVQVRVSTTCAEAINGAADRDSLTSALVDALVACMEAAGGVPVAFVLAQRSGEALMHLRREVDAEDVYVPVDPGTGFLVAHRLQLSVVLARTSIDATDAVPDVHDPFAAFRGAVDEIEWLPDEPR
jgi:hypothetical protein